MINATKVKICGITNQIDAKLAVDFGADAIGFVFAKSPRQVDVRTAKKIIATLPPFVSKIGVFVNETPLVIQKIYQECGLTAVQLHGEEIPGLCKLLTPIPLIKVLRPTRLSDIKILNAYSMCSAFLLDTFAKGKYGGTGKSFDWNIAIEVKKFKKPIILSGGLNSDNVQSAIKKVLPYAVDVSSGVEKKPGKKDPDKLRKFIKNAKYS